jgi:AbrB family looped-hinge helix DNA binding protein
MTLTTAHRRTRPNRVTSKGQVTIPVEIRRAIGIRPGDAVDFVREGQRFVVRRIADPAAEELAREMGYDSAEALAAAVEEGAAVNAARDLKIAREWEPLDAEAHQTWERHRKRRR